MAPRDRPSLSTLAPGRIGATGIALIALAATTPVTVLAAVVPDAYTQGVLAVPPAFAAVGIILLLFAVGYTAMARRAPNAGALYAFIARGLGRPLGVGAGWIAVISYLAIQFALYGMAGAAAAPLLDSWFGATAPWWAAAAGCWLVVALVGFVRVEVAAAMLAVLVLAELAVLTGFAAANLLDPAGSVTVATLRPSSLDRPSLGLLLVVAAGAFIGVETTAAYGEEARGPRRALTRATYAAVAVAALLYTAGAWAMSVAVGPGRIAAAAADRGPELMFDLAGARLAPWAVTLGRVLLLTGLLAAMISLHHTIARYLFALGRERVLPGRLARTARRTSAPRAASLTQSLVVAAGLGACVALHIDPTGRLVGRLSAAGAMGVLVLLVLSSVAALIHLNRVPGAENLWQRFLAPVLSTVGLGTLAYLACVNAPDPWPVLIVLGTLFVLGAVFALILRRAHPVVYAGIGLGGAAIVVAPAIPQQRAPGAHRAERTNR